MVNWPGAACRGVGSSLGRVWLSCRPGERGLLGLVDQELGRVGGGTGLRIARGEGKMLSGCYV